MKEDVLFFINAISTIGLVVLAILGESIPVAIIAGATLIKWAIENKEFELTLNMHSDRVTVISKEESANDI